MHVYDIVTFDGFVNNFEWTARVFVITVNLALHKPAFQSNSHQAKEDISVANYVVDGLKTDPSLDGGQCATTTLGKQTSTWWVDLTSIHSIHHITIYFMTINKGLGNLKTLVYLGFFYIWMSLLQSVENLWIFIYLFFLGWLINQATFSSIVIIFFSSVLIYNFLPMLGNICCF